MSSFEDLHVWRRSKDLAVSLIREISGSKLFALKDQMIRSAVSIPSNIAEGAERTSPKEFAQFISYASGSCAELITQVQIASELEEISKPVADSFLSECTEIGKMLYGLKRSLKVQKNTPNQ